LTWFEAEWLLLWLDLAPVRALLLLLACDVTPLALRRLISLADVTLVMVEPPVLPTLTLGLPPLLPGLGPAPLLTMTFRLTSWMDVKDFIR
jgi:hypothetical protein